MGGRTLLVLATAWVLVACAAVLALTAQSERAPLLVSVPAQEQSAPPGFDWAQRFDDLASSAERQHAEWRGPQTERDRLDRERDREFWADLFKPFRDGAQ